MTEQAPLSYLEISVRIAAFVGIPVVMVLLLLPALSGPTHRPRPPCTNNLRQIGLAFHNYHDKYGTLPPAHTTDRDGRPLHSWRTLILPFLGEQELFKQINLDEPWNSPHNRRFAETRLSCFMCPNSTSGLAYLAIAVPGGTFEGSASRTFSGITDGTSNTVFAIEVVPRPNSWMEPVDFDQKDLDHALAHGLKSQHPGGAQAVLGDGSVRFLSDTMKSQSLSAFLTRNGGESWQDIE